MQIASACETSAACRRILKAARSAAPDEAALISDVTQTVLCSQQCLLLHLIIVIFEVINGFDSCVEGELNWRLVYT